MLLVGNALENRSVTILDAVSELTTPVAPVTNRSRHVTWEDPTLGAALARALV